MIFSAWIGFGLVACGGGGGGGGGGKGTSAIDAPTQKADSGILDSSFGTGGIARHHNAAGGATGDGGQAIAVDAQGRILVAGSSDNAQGDEDMAVWRFDSTGALDTTFGGGKGFFTHHNAGGGNGIDRAYAIALDSQGRILVTGSSQSGFKADPLVVWRLTPEGLPDAAFGGGAGYVVVFGPSFSSGYGIVADSTDRILVVGVRAESAHGADMALWRFHTNGTLDRNFAGGLGFFLHHSAAGGSSDDTGRALAIDSQGRIVVAGSSTSSAGTLATVVWRIGPSGFLDSSFGAGQGFVVHDGASGDDEGNSVAIDSQGRIVVAGYRRNAYGNDDMAVWRWTESGTLDSTFGAGNGFIVHDNAAGGLGEDRANGVAIDASGRIVVAGWSMSAYAYHDLALWRLDSAGSLDPEFGAGKGFVTQDRAAGGSIDLPYAVALDTEGRILVAGAALNLSLNFDVIVWRFH